MSDIEIVALKEDARPAFFLHEVRGANLFRIKASRAAGASTFALKQVEDFSVLQSKPVPDTQLDRADEKKL